MTIKQTADNRIECTLSPEELSARNIKISDLSYGSDKNRSLLEEIMRDAAATLSFEAGNLPLVVEAIPLDSGALTLIITKLEYPEELDARFSRFTPVDENAYPPETYSEDELPAPVRSSADLFSNLDRMAREVSEETGSPSLGESNTDSVLTGPGPMIYSFGSMEDLIALAKLLTPDTMLPASVYRTGKSQGILLMVSPGEYTPNEFRAYCDIISEYSSKDRRPYGSDSLLAEHYSPILDGNALEVLSKL